MTSFPRVVATVTRFEDLDCWQSGRKLRRLAYSYTRLGSFAGDRALVYQIRRAAQSVTANIAEGFERQGSREFAQFLSHAKGSVAEVKDELYTALDEAYITPDQFDAAYASAEHTGRLIGGLMAYLRRTQVSGAKFKRDTSERGE